MTRSINGSVNLEKFKGFEDEAKTLEINEDLKRPISVPESSKLHQTFASEKSGS